MFLNPQHVLAQVGTPHGGHVADFGTGAGHFALTLAERSNGQGSVYAVDALHGVLDRLSREATRRNLPIRTVHSDLNEHIPFRDNLLSFAVAANVLHQLSEKKRFVDELARVVMPGGKVLAIDWASSFRNMGPSMEAVVEPARAAELFRNAGFSVSEMIPAGTHHYGFIATLPASLA